ncbi:MAG: N-methyl-L-tryptophan oxidase [Microbacterium sp.]
MSEQADVVVLGLGVHGSAAVASLARRGRRVVGIERFGPHHERGSSHGRTRMIRRAYPNPVWNDLVARAYDGWGRLERESGRRLIVPTGGMYAHAGASQLQGSGCVVLDDPAQIAARMPGLRVPEGHRAVFDPSAGMIEAAAAIEELRRSAYASGADLRFDTPVLGWDAVAGGVEVRTAEGAVRASRLIVAPGPFAAGLLPQLASVLEVWRIVTVTIASGQPATDPARLGAFSIDRPDGLVFGIPDAAGNGLKVGIDAGEVWDAEEPVAPATSAEIDRLRALIADLVPGADTSVHEAAACLYTMTADRRFVIGPLAATPEVIVASACSGHGFKFGAAIGEALADLADGIVRPDLDFVSTARRGI